MAEWIKHQGAPALFTDYFSTSADGKMYFHRRDDLWIYNIYTKQWFLAKTSPSYQYEAPLAWHKGRIYVIGGRYSGSSFQRAIPEYNPITNNWSRGLYMEDADNHGRASSSASSVGEYIYIFGGYTFDDSSASMPINEIITRGKSIFRLDVNAVQGTPATLSTKLSTSRFGCITIPVGNDIYVVGGMARAAGGDYNISLVERFNVLTEDIKTLSPMPLFEETNSGFAGAYYAGELYCMGSENKTLMIYNIQADEWRTGGAFQNASGIRGMDIVDGNLFVSTNNIQDGIYSYDLRTTNVANLSPSSGFVNEQTENNFSWELVTNPEGLGQKSAEFKWKVLGSTQEQGYIVGSTPYVTVPANIFPNSYIQWRVRATATSDIRSEWTEWATLTTIDQQHGAPTSLRPSNSKHNGTKAIQFSWFLNSYLSTPQTAFEIQVDYETGAGWNNLSGKVATSDSSHISSPNSLAPSASGKVKWRVRTYNSDDVASPWSKEEAVTVLTAPSPPNWIDVEKGKSRPLCKWQSPVDQVAWRLQALLGNTIIYDTGEQQGVSKEHKIEEYLNRGIYIFQIQVKTEIGLWSDYRPYDVNVSASSRTRATLNGEQIFNGSRLFLTDKEVTTQ